MIEGPRTMRNHPSFRPWVPTKVVAASAFLAVLIVIVVETGRPNRSAAPASPISASSIPDAPATIFVKTEAIRPTSAPEPAPVLATMQGRARFHCLDRGLSISSVRYMRRSSRTVLKQLHAGWPRGYLFKVFQSRDIQCLTGPLKSRPNASSVDCGSWSRRLLKHL